MLKRLVCYFKMAISYVLFFFMACGVFVCSSYAANTNDTNTITDLYSDGLIKFSTPEKSLDQDENTYNNPVNKKSVTQAKFAVINENEIVLVNSEEEAEKIKNLHKMTPIYLSSAYKTKIASIVPSLAKSNINSIIITRPHVIPKSNAITLAHVSRVVWDLNNYKVKIPPLPEVVLKSSVDASTVYLVVATCMLLIYLLTQLQLERPIPAAQKNLRRRRSIWRSDFPVSGIAYKVLLVFKNEAQCSLFGGLNILYDLEKTRVLNKLFFNSKSQFFFVFAMSTFKMESINSAVWAQNKSSNDNNYYMAERAYSMQHRFSRQLSPEGFWGSKKTRPRTVKY